MSGRKLLESTLSNLVLQGKEEDRSSLDEEVEEGARDLLRLPGYNSSIYSPNSNRNKPEIKVIKVKASLVKTPIRRKRKKPTSIMLDRIVEDDISEGSNSHVMTFFDRKVDLAQFAPDDPLYMMCRTWMRNDPSNSEETAVPAPSPPQCATDNREIYSLPDPVPLEKDSNGDPIRIDIPTPLDHPQDDNLFTDDVDMVSLRATHLQQWKKVRQNWTSASLKNQQRYLQSFGILREIHY
ncbi:protein lin-37 homolog [Dysidea avara]|uniref:protein lin-37 homolog n=1 Tax=Dysidea avara TaxID=196820 RepID=UPI003322704C